MKRPYCKIIKFILTILGLTLEDLLGCHKNRKVSDARALIAAALKTIFHLSQKDIANTLGRSQAAVSKMQKRHEDLLGSDREYKEKWDRVKEKEIE